MLSLNQFTSSLYCTLWQFISNNVRLVIFMARRKTGWWDGEDNCRCWKLSMNNKTFHSQEKKWYLKLRIVSALAAYILKLRITQAPNRWITLLYSLLGYINQFSSLNEPVSIKGTYICIISKQINWPALYSQHKPFQ